jgi:hypothetical protein
MFMIRPQAQLRLVFLLVSIVLAPFFAEGLFSIFAVVASRSPAAAGAGVDGRTRREIISELRASGVDAFPTIQPALLLEPGPDRRLKSIITVEGTELLPLGGVADKPTILCNETGQYIIYQSDERGFHNPKGIWSRTMMDVAAVGDSLTHGACVPSDKSAVALIRNHYPGTINLGMSHNGPLFMLAAIREYLPRVKPRAVLWLHSESDLMDLEFEKRSPLLRRYLRDDGGQGLIDRQAAIDESLVAYVLERLNQPAERRTRGASLGLERAFGGGTARHVSLTEILKLTETRRLLRTVATHKSTAPDDWPLFSETLAAARDTVASWNGRLFFVYIPSYLRYQRFGPGDAAHGQALAVAHKLKIPVIDATEAFEAEGDPRALFARPHRDAHYNEKGYQVVADSILKVLAGDVQTSEARR